MKQIGRAEVRPRFCLFEAAGPPASRLRGVRLKEMTFTLNVIDSLGNILKTEDFGSPDGVLERVELLKKTWTKAQLIQVCANDTPLFAIDLKRG
jgi:hypothetical protein